MCPFREFGHLDCGGLDRDGLHKYGNKNHPMYINLKNHVPILIQADERKNYWNDLTNCHKFPLDPPKYGVNVIYTDTQFNGRL